MDLSNRIKMVLAVISVGMLSGCATTSQPTAVNNLQIQVAHLEKSVEAQNSAISDLQYQMQDLTRQVGVIDSTDVSAPIEEPAKSIKSTGTKSDDDTIRVDVNPKDVQKALKAAGYYEGEIDGKIGSGTKRAIQNFQKDNGLKADGVLGKKTWSELKPYLSK